METSPNLKDYAKEYRDFSLLIPEKFSFPLDVFDKWDNRLALFWTDGFIEKKFSFNEMKALSSKAAGAFIKLGIKKGHKVIVMLPNIPEWWEIMLGLMRINAIPIPATTLMTAKDLGYRLSATDIKAVIAMEEDVSKVEEAVSEYGAHSSSASGNDIPILVVIGQRQGWHDYIQERSSADTFEGERAAPGDPALIYFTSGTTGLPKMVLHTQASYPIAHSITGKYWLDLRPGDIHWNLSDTGWAKAAYASFFGPWNAGAAIFSLYKKGKFDPAFTLECLSKYPVTTFCGPPTAYRMMAREISDIDAFRLPGLRHFAAAGEPLNKEIIEIWKKRTGKYIYDGYGQTETVIVLANFRCLDIKPGSMGKPAPGFIVDIVGSDGNTVPPGTEGDIGIRVKPERPAGLFREYLGNPDATSRTLRGQWYITGDRAYKDTDGYFWFIGREDDIILASGYRIGPFEIESVLIEHPAVKESAVVASPDEIRGEVVKAFIVPTKNYPPSEALAKELQDFVKKRTAPYKYPRKIEFVGELPKTISGKIKRKELKLKEFKR